MTQLHKNLLNLWVRGRVPPAEHLKENFVANKEGLWIWFEELACPNPKGLIILVHGLAEDSSRHLHVARRLQAAGFYVVLFDLQGCGRSDGERNHVSTFDNYVDEVYLVAKTVLSRRKHLEHVPKFVQGHSMGGLIAVLATHPREMAKNGVSFKGIVITGPALLPDPKTATPVNRMLAKKLGGCIPKFRIFWESGPGPKYRVSSLDAAQYRYETDPMLQGGVKGGLRVGQMYQFLVAMDKANAQAGEFTIPYLAMHGTNDGFTLIEGTRKWHASTSSADKTFVPVEGGHHEIMNEADPMRTQVLERIDAWYAARTGGGNRSSAPSMANAPFGAPYAPSMGLATGAGPVGSRSAQAAAYGVPPVPGMQYGGYGAYGGSPLMPGHPAYGFRARG